MKSFAIKVSGKAQLKLIQQELNELKEHRDYERNVQAAIEMLKRFKTDLKKGKETYLDFRRQKK